VSNERWLLSTLIAIHLVAVSAASLPDPRELNFVPPAATSPPIDSIARIATPTLNAAADALSPLEAQAYRLTAPVRALTRFYIQAGLRQRWNMFSNPVTADQYMRVAHYVRSAREPNRLRVFRELALPGQPENRARLVHMFRDKALMNSIEAFVVNGQEHPDVEPSDLVPVAAYFGNRFRSAYLTAGEEITRTEIWYGLAPTPPTGDRLTDSQLQKRWDVLQRYWDGPLEVSAPVTPLQRGALQGEADIVWRLNYVQNR
jgi:hypothetical protein